MNKELLEQLRKIGRPPESKMATDSVLNMTSNYVQPGEGEKSEMHIVSLDSVVQYWASGYEEYGVERYSYWFDSVKEVFLFQLIRKDGDDDELQSEG